MLIRSLFCILIVLMRTWSLALRMVIVRLGIRSLLLLDVFLFFIILPILQMRGIVSFPPDSALNLLHPRQFLNQCLVLSLFFNLYLIIIRIMIKQFPNFFARLGEQLTKLFFERSVSLRSLHLSVVSLEFDVQTHPK